MRLGPIGALLNRWFSRPGVPVLLAEIRVNGVRNTPLHQQDSDLLASNEKDGPGGVTDVPKPLSPRNRSRVNKLSPTYRSRVPKLSSTYRSHSVHHEPKPHITSSHNLPLSQRSVW